MATTNKSTRQQQHWPDTEFFVEVPGARLHCVARGAGPVLLLIPGGALDAGIYTPLARLLADRRCVVTYDPRGNSRSTLRGAAGPQDVDVHGDDAARVLAAIGDSLPTARLSRAARTTADQVGVFGSSGGAQIGLNLAARYPASLGVLVAHEPPCSRLLEDPAPDMEVEARVVAAYRTGGVAAAMQAFMAETGLAETPRSSEEHVRPVSDEERDTRRRTNENLPSFFEHGMLTLSGYIPDVRTLRAGAPRVIVAVGSDSAGQPIDRSTRALAHHLNTEVLVFPGDHLGYASHAASFAELLHHCLMNAIQLADDAANSSTVPVAQES